MSVFEWDSSIISSQLPLLPGKSIQLPVNIFGKLSSYYSIFLLNKYQNLV